MIEVLSENYKKLLPDILKAISTAKFIAIDTEFTALYLNEADKPSLFDTPAKRYAKLRNTVNNIIPVQVGLSAFSFNPDANSYESQTYTFYIWPKPIMSINHSLQFQASSFQFLSRFNFDYNKLIYGGVPFLNDQQEKQLLNDLETNKSRLDFTNEHFINEIIGDINQWFHEASNETFTVAAAKAKLNGDLEALHHVQYYLRNAFQNKVWTAINDDNDLILTKVSAETFHAMNSKRCLVQDTLEQALGFTQVFRALVQSHKPLVGHNMLMDMMLLHNTFGESLPRSYGKFKQVVHTAFPRLFDTKTLSFEVKRMIARNKWWKSSTLQDLYDYFKDQQGRHLAFNSPLIRNASAATNDADHFHNAGWDSYCTGYVFVRMAHYLATKDQVSNMRDIMSSEHIAAVTPWENQLNLIHASVSYLVLDGNDPESTRPPCLVAESNRKELNISNISMVLSKYGQVEIKSINATSALIAVDNWRNAKRILKDFHTTNEFAVQRYTIIKHGKYSKHIKFGVFACVSLALLVGICHRPPKIKS